MSVDFFLSSVERETKAQPTILVVEDEIFLRFDIAVSLREQGYSVIEAVSGDEALDLLASGIPCDLVISDVRMLGSMDGLDLLARLKADRPDSPFILMSAIQWGGEASAANSFIEKPFEMKHLLAIVARLVRPD